MIIVLSREFLRSIALALVIATSARAADSGADLPHEHVTRWHTEPSFTINREPVTATLLPDFYEPRAFNLAWTDPEKIDHLIALLEGAYDHGLDPNEYHLSTLKALRQGKAWQTSTAQQRVDLDLLITKSVARLAYHLRYGKVDPATLDTNWNFERLPLAKHPVENVLSPVCAHSPEEFFRRLVPEPYFYQWLRRGLARYRQIRDAGGWPTVPEGPSLRLDAIGPRVELLRKRLRPTEDLSGDERADPGRFDKALETAVIVFQLRHGLDPDGVVGPKTLRALNISAAERVDQIRVNLERMRWVYQSLPREYVLVDIAGYHVYLVREGQELWSARSQVGHPYRETPVFRAEMKYLVFNPAWTVPPIILINDILPAAKRDPSYLRRNHMRLLDDTGQPVSIAAIDWTSVSAWNFPYTVRQNPGPNNALGRVKFIFPNNHLVYLHDTPNKNLFAQSQRTFSSGCIRVERPFELAAMLLANAKDWSPERIREVLASGQTERVSLIAPLPVLLVYWTAKADQSGAVHFRTDVYGRDQRVLRALDGKAH